MPRYIPSRRANGFLLATDIIDGALFWDYQRERVAGCLFSNFCAATEGGSDAEEVWALWAKAGCTSN